MKFQNLLLSAIFMLSLVPEARADKVTEAKLRFERGVELIRSGEVRKGLDELLISNHSPLTRIPCLTWRDCSTI